MGRIAVFLVVIAGTSYLLIGWLLPRVLGIESSPVLRASLSVIVAVILWGVVVWFAGDRIGTEPSDEERRSSG